MIVNFFFIFYTSNFVKIYCESFVIIFVILFIKINFTRS